MCRDIVPFPEHYWQLFLTTKNHLCFSSHDRRSLVYQTKHNFSQLETGPITLRLRRKKKKREKSGSWAVQQGMLGWMVVFLTVRLVLLFWSTLLWWHICYVLAAACECVLILPSFGAEHVQQMCARWPAGCIVLKKTSQFQSLARVTNAARRVVLWAHQSLTCVSYVYWTGQMWWLISKELVTDSQRFQPIERFGLIQTLNLNWVIASVE